MECHCCKEAPVAQLETESTMTRLNGVFDGNVVILDQPVPADLKPNTPVEILVPDQRLRAVAEINEFLTKLWQTPAPPGTQPSAKRWTREELHERR